VVVGVAVGVSMGVGIDVAVCVGVTVGVLVGVGVAVGVGVLVDVGVAVGVGVTVGVLVGVGVAVGVGVLVGAIVGVGQGVNGLSTNWAQPDPTGLNEKNPGTAVGVSERGCGAMVSVGVGRSGWTGAVFSHPARAAVSATTVRTSTTDFEMHERLQESVHRIISKRLLTAVASGAADAGIG